MDLRSEDFMSLGMAAMNAVNRRRFVGGSDARIIMGADEVALIRLWREKRGEVEPEDLSGNLIVQLGNATEPLNRAWYERNTGRAITDVQRWVRHPVNRWMAATLDPYFFDDAPHREFFEDVARRERGPETLAEGIEGAGVFAVEQRPS